MADDFTQLLEAICNDEPQVVTESLKTCPEFIYRKDKDGNTLLHFVCNENMAEILLASIESNKQEIFLWMKSNDGRTAFDSAIIEQKTEVVVYLFNYAKEKELTKGKIYPSDCPLHYVQTEEMAQLLVGNVPESERMDFLRIRDTDKRTALHKASERGFEKVANYFCLQGKDLLFCVDNAGNTALHLSHTKEVVQVLYKYMYSLTSKKDFLWTPNRDRNTALHMSVAAGNVNVATELCTLDVDNLVYCQNANGDTALHLAPTEELAQLLIDCLPFIKRSEFIQIENANGKSAVDQELDKNPGIFCCLRRWVWLDLLLTPRQLVDKDRFLALHPKWWMLEVGKFVELFKLMLSDNLADGYSLASYLVSKGEVELFEDLLCYIQLHYGEGLKLAIQHTNQLKQNLLHLSCLSPFVEDLFEILQSCFDRSLIVEALTPDCINSTPIMYLVGRGLNKLSIALVFCLPLRKRKQYFSSKNDRGVNCVQISSQAGCPRQFFFSKVVPNVVDVVDGCMGDLSKGYISPQDKKPCLIKYVLNEYQETELDEIEDIKKFRKVSPPSSSSHCAFVWFLCEARDLSSIQRSLYTLGDSEKNHETPKVIVIMFPVGKEVTYIAPPGPDFIIFTVVLKTPSLQLEEDFSPTDVSDLISYFRMHLSVDFVNVNSTLARHYKSPDEGVPSYAYHLQKGEKGQALVICSTHKRSKHERDLEGTKEMCELLGLKYEVEFNKSADGVRQAIKTFASRKDHGTLAAVFITSHGDGDGNIYGNYMQSNFTVQEVVDLMKDIDCFKFVFLTFCRGKIQQCNCNRTLESPVYQSFIQDQPHPDLGRVRTGVSRATLNKERKRRVEKLAPQPPFPSIKVPERMMLVYPTLPDSSLTDYSETRPWSMNKMPKGFISHLSMERDERPVSMEVHSFLTDVAGVVREMSDFTQYMNFGYTVTRNSLPVYLEIGAV